MGSQKSKPKNVDETDQAHKINGDNQVKIVFLGSVESGKTIYQNQYMDHMFLPENGNVADHCTKDLETPKYGKIQVQIWGTAGEERYFSVSKSFIRNCDAAILMYAIDDRESFDFQERFQIPKTQEVILTTARCTLQETNAIESKRSPGQQIGSATKRERLSRTNTTSYLKRLALSRTLRSTILCRI